MPNHVTNVLKVSGTNYTVKRMLEEIGGESNDPDYPCVIDFSKIVPMPELLSHIGKGRTTIDGVDYDRWYYDADPNGGYSTVDRPLTRGELIELENYAEKDWYDWSCVHWGTKWNAYSQSYSEQSTERLATVITITFQTAWACPEPVLLKLAEMFDTLKFNLTFADEDTGSNCGRNEYVEGKLVSEYYPESQSLEAYEIAIEVDEGVLDYLRLVDGNYEYYDEDEVA
jgi:hypothetical protein